MDETTMAFEMPHVRAAATAASGLIDRILVRDYMREVEIGAFRSERGVTQRIRFNVVLEVAHSAASATDDVDKVLSYETITEAIEAALAAERLNLLETLAERVAAGCLADPRAARVFVRIEKLDRIPGAFGVEIARIRVSDAPARLHPVAPQPAPEAGAGRPVVVHFGATLLAGPDAAAWLDAFVAAPRPAVLTLAPLQPQPPARAEGALRVGLLAVEAAAWTLSDRDPRLTVAASRAELDWALKSARHPIWAPIKMLTDALPRPTVDASGPVALAGWLAVEIGAEALVLAGAAPCAAPEGVTLRLPERPEALFS